MWLGSVLMARPQASRTRSLLVPDHNVPRLDTDLLQPLGNRHHQRMVGADALAAEAVDLEADDLAFGNKFAGTMRFHASAGCSRPV
jgi:hypothetical protein